MNNQMVDFNQAVIKGFTRYDCLIALWENARSTTRTIDHYPTIWQIECDDLTDLNGRQMNISLSDFPKINPSAYDRLNGTGMMQMVVQQLVGSEISEW
jgi:hypothetical protein